MPAFTNKQNSRTKSCDLLFGLLQYQNIEWILWILWRIKLQFTYNTESKKKYRIHRPISINFGIFDSFWCYFCWCVCNVGQATAVKTTVFFLNDHHKCFENAKYVPYYFISVLHKLNIFAFLFEKHQLL